MYLQWRENAEKFHTLIWSGQSECRNQLIFSCNSVPASSSHVVIIHMLRCTFELWSSESLTNKFYLRISCLMQPRFIYSGCVLCRGISSSVRRKKREKRLFRGDVAENGTENWIKEFVITKKFLPFSDLKVNLNFIHRSNTYRRKIEFSFFLCCHFSNLKRFRENDEEKKTFIFTPFSVF